MTYRPVGPRRNECEPALGMGNGVPSLTEARMGGETGWCVLRIGTSAASTCFKFDGAGWGQTGSVVVQAHTVGDEGPPRS